MPKVNDNRMKWIRSLEKPLTKKGDYYVQHEIGSECRIVGALDYMNDNLLCRLFMFEKSKIGLYHYILKIRYPGLKEPYYNVKANKSGYYFKDGILGELVSLFSLFFRCRFYLISSLSAPLASKDAGIKTEHDFTYKKCNPDIHPQIFVDNGKSFSKGLDDFLDSARALNVKYHQQLILACYHYTRALKEIGIDHEMVFIRLVSAIETLSRFVELDKKDDLLKDKNINKAIDKFGIDSGKKEELKKIFETRKSKKKFIRFIENYSKGFFRGGNYKAKHLKIKKADLPKTLSAIYDARSNYLHNGEPMFLSRVVRGLKALDKDPVTGMIIDNRKVPASTKLPYTHFFEGLVRHCLLNFLEANKE